LNKSLLEHEQGSETRETLSWSACRNKSFNASSVSLDDKVTMSSSVGKVEQCGIEAHANLTGCKACAG
jgi:hypothetical protein